MKTNEKKQNKTSWSSPDKYMTVITVSLSHTEVSIAALDKLVKESGVDSSTLVPVGKVSGTQKGTTVSFGVRETELKS